jgi:flagellar hook-length control protein FliK
MSASALAIAPGPGPTPSTTTPAGTATAGAKRAATADAGTAGKGQELAASGMPGAPFGDVLEDQLTTTPLSDSSDGTAAKGSGRASEKGKHSDKHDSDSKPSPAATQQLGADLPAAALHPLTEPASGPVAGSAKGQGAVAQLPGGVADDKASRSAVEHAPIERGTSARAADAAERPVIDAAPSKTPIDAAATKTPIDAAAAKTPIDAAATKTSVATKASADAAAKPASDKPADVTRAQLPTQPQSAQSHSRHGADSGTDGDRREASTRQPAVTAARQPAASAAAAHHGAPTTFAAETQSVARPATTFAPMVASGSRPVALHHAAEAVRGTLQLAARGGASQARIQLTPETLGGIRIVLRQTQDGLTARVVADHPAAAHTLEQSAADLRRSLESAGVNVLRLDIGTSDQSDQSAGNSGHADGSGAAGGQRRTNGTEPVDGTEQSGEAIVTELPAGRVPTGELVDVLV